MKASELMIGNYLQYKTGESFQIHAQDFGSIESMPEYLHPNAIELTEEWLLRFCFDWRRIVNEVTQLQSQ